MATKQTYTNVSDLVHATTQDDDLRTAFKEHIASRGLVKQLLVLRAMRGLSQADIAASLHCTQSRVSKIEGFSDNDMRIGDLRGYAAAVDCEFIAGFIPRDMKPVDKVKCHVLAIKTHMDDLAELARTDEKIAEGVAGFFSELFFNFARLFGDSVKRLPLAPNDLPYLDFRLAEICPCQRTRGSVDDAGAAPQTDKNRLQPATS